MFQLRNLSIIISFLIYIINKHSQFEQQNIQSPLLAHLCAWMCVCVCVHWHVFLFVSFVSLNKINNIWYFLLHWHWTGSDNISIKLINYLSSPIYSGPDTHFVALRCFLCFCFFLFPHFCFQLFHKVFVRFLSVFSCRKMFRISVHAHT